MRRPLGVPPWQPANLAVRFPSRLGEAGPSLKRLPVAASSPPGLSDAFPPQMMFGGLRQPRCPLPVADSARPRSRNRQARARPASWTMQQSWPSLVSGSSAHQGGGVACAHWYSPGSGGSGTCRGMPCADAGIGMSSARGRPGLPGGRYRKWVRFCMRRKDTLVGRRGAVMRPASLFQSLAANHFFIAAVEAAGSWGASPDPRG
jgi:hypothetical protein